MNKNYLKLTFKINHIIFLQLLIMIYLKECPIDNPILLKNNSCLSINCSKEEFESKDCIINNSKIKTQWITNIIIIGDKDFRFINFVTYSNGDFVVETTPCPGDDRGRRKFFGLKNNGRGLFLNNSQETPFYYIHPQNQNNEGKKYESELFIARINSGEDKDKEFVVSMSKDNGYAELYDFNHDKIYQKQTSQITNKEHQSKRQAGLLILGSDNKYYSIYGFLLNGQFNIFKFSFSSINSIENNLDVKENDGENQIGNVNENGFSVSCFKTTNNIIICFYYNNERRPVIYAMDENFIKKGILSLNYKGDFDGESFIKCVHFIQEIGAFSFYDYDNNNNYYPYIYLMNFVNGNFENPLENLPEKYIILNYYSFEMYTLMNDLTKLSDNKLCFTATTSEHDTLYIILLSIINFEKVKIRYYSFQIYNLLYYKFLKDMKSYSYNGFVMIGSSMCRQEECYNDHDHSHFSSLIVFSYPNSTDVDFDISEYLFKHNNITIERLEIDLKDYVIIENNIFGYIFSGIKIKNISTYDIIKLYSSKTGDILNNDYPLNVDENIKIKFENNDYLKDNCSFTYYYIVTEPDRNIYDEYPTKIDLSFGNDTEEYFNSAKTEYIGRISYFNIYLKNNLVKTPCSDYCDLCYSNSQEFCITCRLEYYYDSINDGTKIKKCNQTLDSTIYSTIDSTIDSTIYSTIDSTIYPTIDFTIYSSIFSTLLNYDNSEESSINIEIPVTSEDLENSINVISSEIYPNENGNCSINAIINNLCKNRSISNDQNEEVYKKLKQDCLNYNCSVQNKIVETNNIIYQISTYNTQKDNNYLLSNIELGECENKLRKKYEMSDEDEFIIFKRDIKNELTTYVEYEIYNSGNLVLLNLDICNDNQININIPVNLKQDTELLYNKLSQLGYNLFDANDSFYNDICSPYTNENGTDMLLSDRKEDIYKNNGNITLCQSGCVFNSYNTQNKKAKCKCEIQKNINIEANIDTDIYKKFDTKEFTDNFYSTLENSNFRILKCYKLVLTFNYLFKNIGRILMTIIFSIILVLLFICIFFEQKRIKIFISNILKTKINNSNLNYNNKEKKEKKRKSMKINIKRNSQFINFGVKKKKRKSVKFEPPKKDKKVSRKKLFIISEKKKGKNNNNSSYSKRLLNKKPTLNINSNNINVRGQKRKSISKKSNDKMIIMNQPETNIKIYNDRELNSLKYLNAINYDKRTYCQYYCSLLKQKQLILFTFLPAVDYNLYSLKIILFLLSFSLYFCVNGLFFNDDTMHKIYIDKGAYNIIYQIPQIMYSSILSAIINIILKQLSLSENNILKLKQEKDYKVANKNSKSIYTCLNIKFIIFYFLCLIFMAFFWYFISCFCAVFSNTQIILIKDTLLSFALSMIYPFGLNLLPGFFRIPALKSKKKDKECLYKISLLIAII